ncbi:MAG: hypothetical protein ACI4S4_01405, partial [Candidatus Ornithospirochaeta sp.]
FSPYHNLGMARTKKTPTEITSVKKRRNKDKEIEVLTARNEYLENRLKASEAMRAMGEKEKKAIVVVFSIFVIVTALMFALLAAKSHSIAARSADDYRRILTEVDAVKWQCSESTRDNLKFLIPSATGKVYSYREGENLVLHFVSEDNLATSIIFSFRSGMIHAFYRGASIDLEFSRTITGSGKTLGLVFGEKKIVLSAVK